jgi:DNA polymerase III subunit alpha
MFAHLHVHSQYSIADATARVDELCTKVAEMGMTSVAITDHDNLHGAVHFAKAAKKAGIKAIYGCCLSIAARPMGEHVLRTHHLTLLAETDEGYANLVHLVSKAHLLAPSGGSPRIDHALLAERSAGLICLSGDMSGEIPNALLRGQQREVDRHVKRYMELFGPERFFVEVQNAGLVEDESLRPQLYELADRHGLRCVATGDVHYINRDGARAHEVLMCIGLGLQTPDDPDWLPTAGYWLADQAEMQRRFDDRPDAVQCAADIAERCNVTLDLGKTYLPKFDVPDGHTITSYFQKLSTDGLQERFDEFRKFDKTFDEQVYKERLEIEIGVIKRMDFPGYFLIVWDFIRWAREQGIAVGPGRGSGAGSLVAYSLKITDIDPLPYNLLFERFLNEERVSLPDFDIDFCVKRRGDVIDYVAGKYGVDHVAQIATFGTLKPRGAIRDAGRVLGVPLSVVDEIAKLVPDDLKITVESAMAREPRLRERAAQDPEIHQLLEAAAQIEGAVRNVGTHAAGVVISEKKLWEYVPVFRGAGNEIVTQFAKDEVEEAGLVKFDFLGLKNLTMIQHCTKLINDTRGPGEAPLDIIAIPLDSEEAYGVMGRGDTAGIFQMESEGFTRMIKELRPTEFDDVIAAGALYRPGPLGMGMHTRYIQRKHGNEPVEFDHPLLEPILKETYGVIVYQEQVMQIARELAGFSLGGADILRRAMGKKKKAEMDEQRKIFLAGTAEREIDEETAKGVFSLMESFADYGFNKSHAAAYGLITYQTAYLKAHHRTEFFAALLTADKDDTGKVVGYLQAARLSKIQVLPPHINASQLSFSVVDDVIRFGLGAIKGVGSGAVEVLLQARESGPFASLFDLCRRVDMKRVNRRVIEALVKCGAFDCFEQPREVLWSNVDKGIERAQAEQREKESGQTSLFGAVAGAVGFEVDDRYLPAKETWTARQTLEYEKACLGFYVTGHPLDRFSSKLWRLDCQTLSRCQNPEILKQFTRGKFLVKSAAVVVSFRERKTRKDKQMGILVIEDLSAQAELLCFDPVLSRLREVLSQDVPLLLTLNVQRDRRDESQVSLRIEDASPLELAMADMSDYLRITLTLDQCHDRSLKELRELLLRNGRAFTPVDSAAAVAEEDNRQTDMLGEAAEDETDEPQAAATDEPDPDEPPPVEESKTERVGRPVPAAPKKISPVQVEFTIRVPGKGVAKVVAGNGLTVLPTEDVIGAVERLVGRGRVSLG